MPFQTRFLIGIAHRLQVRLPQVEDEEVGLRAGREAAEVGAAERIGAGHACRRARARARCRRAPCRNAAWTARPVVRISPMKSMPCESVPRPVLMPARGEARVREADALAREAEGAIGDVGAGIGEDLELLVGRAAGMREDHVAAEQAGVARVLGGAHPIPFPQKRNLLWCLREVGREDAAQVVRRLAAIAQQLGQAGVGRVRADRRPGRGRRALRRAP